MQKQNGTPAVDIRNITLGYGATPVVYDFSLSVSKGEIHALAGENGAGKTTVLKAIGRLLKPSSGDIRFPAFISDDVARIGFVLQHDVLPANLSVSACIQCAAAASKQETNLDSTKLALSRVGLQISSDTKVVQLSLHQRQLLQLACALVSKPSLLLLDEPTAVMSLPDSVHFWDLIRSEVTKGLTVIIATHKLEDISEYCSTVTVMRTGRHVFTRQTADISVADILAGMAPQTTAEPKTMRSHIKEIGVHPVIQITTDASSLTVHAREIHGFAGLDGSGYKQWLHATALDDQKGINVTIDGIPVGRTSVAKRRTMGITYIPADRQADAIVDNETLESNIWFGALPDGLTAMILPIDPATQRKVAEGIVTKYDVRPPVTHAPINTFSGGNQQKFVIGRELERVSKVLVIDQPTRGLDRLSSEAVSNHIQSAVHRDMSAVIVYSDDLSFLIRTCDRISTFSGGHLTETRSASDWSEASLIEAIV